MEIQALKDLERLDPPIRKRVVAAVQRFAELGRDVLKLSDKTPPSIASASVVRRDTIVRNPFRRRDYERFDGPGFVMEREGRFLRMKSTLDASGHSRMRQMLGESVDDIKQDMSKQVDDLYSILHRYRAECVLGALWFRNAPMGSTAANHEKKEDTVLAHVEYLAILYARNRGFGNEYIVLPDVLEDIEQRIESLFHATAWLWMAQDAARHGTEEANASRDLWFMTLMNSLARISHQDLD